MRRNITERRKGCRIKCGKYLVRGQFHAVALAGDLRKTFLQVRVKEKERDALRFHWLRSIDSNEVETLPFGCSPFLLGGVIEQHLAGWNDKRPGSVAEISGSLYVGDLISGANDVEKCQDLKSDATEIFADASLELHKWHSTASELEDQCANPENSEDTTYAKEQLGCMYVCMYVFNFFRDAILISYTAGFHEGRLFSYLQVYKNEEKTN